MEFLRECIKIDQTKDIFGRARFAEHREDREGIGVYRARNLTIRGLKVTLTGGDGLYLKDCDGCTFVDLVLDDNYRQVRATNPRTTDGEPA